MRTCLLGTNLRLVSLPSRLDSKTCTHCTPDYLLTGLHQAYAGDAFRLHPPLTFSSSFPGIKEICLVSHSWVISTSSPVTQSDDVTLDALAYLLGATPAFWDGLLGRSGGLNMIRLRLVILIPLLQLFLGCFGIFDWRNTWFHLFVFFGGGVRWSGLLGFFDIPGLRRLIPPETSIWILAARIILFFNGFFCTVSIWYFWALPSSIRHLLCSARRERGKGMDGYILCIGGVHLSSSLSVLP